ncbi:uncharacterized protein LOC104882507 [Vitis vinifera]|uniref:uncharacterized protein LOC104882507 n=1 Tax=Vitis vinifera TaxID=29760 RepID=UPI0008FF7FC6|nr:uncharacterized protein LOC104882507 [Vitis vinifera]|eukprot:XP_010664452.2 PREDICTED: uncharacterized protein LOC104882507 [Vitis vinifera]
MVAPLLTCEDNHPTMTGLLPNKKRTLAHDPLSLESPGSTKHVVIVMDALKEFTTEILEWVLENIFEAGGTVTLLGVTPWPNIPILSKIRSDIWELGLQDLSIIEERNEGKSDAKYQKLQAIVDLCQKYGAVPQIKVAMGYPVRSVVIEQIISLHATWVVFDRNHQKYREFYASKVPCNMVVMNDEGGFDMIKGRAMINDGDTPGESPLSLAPTPKVVLSEQLKEKAQENDDKESVHEKERTGNGMKQGG